MNWWQLLIGLSVTLLIGSLILDKYGAYRAAKAIAEEEANKPKVIPANVPRGTE